jgi:ATP/maltotriose-dependent transcriptional regulator MalT
MPGEKNLGVTVSRTLIPTLPTGYLSRRHLFPLLDNESAGTTFVIAPQGYGKTTLVSEWAQNQSKGVIWLTVANGDTTNEMSAMLIAATRRVLPEFAPWFEKDQPIRPTEVVRRWGNDLLETGREYIFVLDNLQNPENEDVEIEVKLIEQFPRNVQFVAVRTNQAEAIYEVCASRGAIKVISANELRFSPEETEQYAINSGIAIDENVKNILQASSGWAAATALLIAHLQANGSKQDLQKIMSSSTEPLRALVMLVVDGLDSRLLDLCERLAVLEIFTTDEAQLLLSKSYDFAMINEIAHKGEIFAPLRTPGEGYAFSPMVRQVLLERLNKRGALKVELHKKLIEHFIAIGNPSAAISHAFEIGDQEKISTLFPEAARIKQAQGKGGELIRWSVFAGMSPEDGELKKSTVMITGLLADLDFTSAQSEISKLKLLAGASQNSEFFRQFSVGAEAYSLLSLGRFEELESSLATLDLGGSKSMLGVDDQINLLRLLATKRYIWNEADGVESAYAAAVELAKKTSLATSHAFLLSIEAMHLHQRGEYRRAFDVANVGLNQYKRNKFVGNHGPLDVMYVMARCLLEFSKPQEALTILDEVRKSAQEWKQWHWFFASDQHFMEHLTYLGKTKEALERVRIAREKAASIDSAHQLQVFCDLAEMNIRRNLKDFDRLENLINRAPNIRHVRQMKMAVDEFRGRKAFREDAKYLPSSAPRDAIWKCLMEVSINIESENIALPAMRKALQIGAEVGAKETFLRQRDEMGNLIIRIANDYPTVYNEEIASAMAERIKERGNTMKDGQPALTKRELEILRQLSTGRTLTIIAAELHISQNTMKTHLKNLYKKMGAEDRHDAVEKAKASFLI